MNLTHHYTPAKMTPYCKSSRGSRNPLFRQGDKTPQLLAVFLCLSFCAYGRVHIMMGLFGQSLWLVSPCRDFSTPFNPVANVVENTDDGFTTLRQGITA